MVVSSRKSRLLARHPGAGTTAGPGGVDAPSRPLESRCLDIAPPGRTYTSNRPPTTRPARPTDARPHVAALRELAALGWRVVEIRPDREPPLLWTVTVRRHDHNVEVTIHEADPDAALEEALHFAACDEDEPSVELPPESELPKPPAPESTSDGAPSSEGSPRTRDELEAALSALGWQVVTGPVQAADGWTATMRRGTTNVPMTGVKELDLFESMVRYAEHRAEKKP